MSGLLKILGTRMQKYNLARNSLVLWSLKKPHQMKATVSDTVTVEALSWCMLWSRLVSLVSDHLSLKALVILAPLVYSTSGVYKNHSMIYPLKRYILTTEDSTCKDYFWRLSGGACGDYFRGLQTGPMLLLQYSTITHLCMHPFAEFPFLKVKIFLLP